MGWVDYDNENAECTAVAVYDESKWIDYSYETTTHVDLTVDVNVDTDVFESADVAAVPNWAPTPESLAGVVEFMEKLRTAKEERITKEWLSRTNFEWTDIVDTKSNEATSVVRVLKCTVTGWVDYQAGTEVVFDSIIDEDISVQTISEDGHVDGEISVETQIIDFDEKLKLDYPIITIPEATHEADLDRDDFHNCKTAKFYEDQEFSIISEEAEDGFVLTDC